MFSHKKDIRLYFLFFLYPIFASVISFLFKIDTLASVLFFYIIPSIHLSFLLPGSVKKSALFSLLVLILWTPLDYVMHLTGQWVVPLTVFPAKVLGLVPLEDLIWVFFLSYLIIMFYEYFFDKHRDRKFWRPKMKYLISFYVSVFFVFIIAFSFFPGVLYVPFFYFWVGLLLMLVPVVFEFFRKPYLLGKVFPVAIYFFFLALSMK